MNSKVIIALFAIDAICVVLLKRFTNIEPSFAKYGWVLFTVIMAGIVFSFRKGNYTVRMFN